MITYLILETGHLLSCIGRRGQPSGRTRCAGVGVGVGVGWVGVGSRLACSSLVALEGMMVKNSFVGSDTAISCQRSF